MDLWLEKILQGVQKPGRYIGEEWNSVKKDWDRVRVHVLLCFPDIYELGMSNLGIKILYGLLNEREDVLCERVFAPWADLEEVLRREGRELFSLESKKPIKEFDIIGFSLAHELTYTNVLNILDLGNIPKRSRDRDPAKSPLIIAGGTCCYNPEPMAEFIDAFLVGEGEEAIQEIIDVYKKSAKKEIVDRDLVLNELAGLQGVSVPSLCDVQYKGDGTVDKFYSKANGVRPVVRKRVVKDLDLAYYPTKQIVPHIQIIHDRIPLEIMRGCPHRCKFCQASVTYGPKRERSKRRILELAAETYDNTGYEEISLMSLSSGDHGEIKEIIKGLNETFRGKAVSVSVPSLRIEEMVKGLPFLIAEVKKAGLTFAPESGSVRLRREINKKIDIDKLLSAATEAYRAGWRRIKLYFMIGLPTEEEQDLIQIIELIDRVSILKKEIDGTRAFVTVSLAAFIPKPHTPFQLEPMEHIEELKAKKDLLLKRFSPRRKVKVNFHDFEKSYLECIFSRGDRRLSRVLLRAWEKGARFDSWCEHFKMGLWHDAFKELDLDPDFYAYRRRNLEETLPWGFIDIGLTKRPMSLDNDSYVTI